MKTLLLTAGELAQLIHEDDAFEAMKAAFQAHARGEALMPAKIYLSLEAYHGDFRAMPAYLKNPEACGLKWINAHPDNVLEKGLPAVMGMLILNDPATGFPLCVLDATWVTRLRTGAAGALASTLLARPDSKILGLVGCGVQAEAQLIAHLRVFKIHEVRVWGPELELALAFKERMKGVHGNIQAKSDIRECVCGADILCTTTPSRRPLVIGEWTGQGLHINAIGADAKGKQELDPAILKEAVLVVDDLEQSLHGGEVNVPFSEGVIHEDEIDATLGEVVCGLKKGRLRAEDLTVFDSTGLAIQDIALGYRAYQRALERNLGQRIDFFK